MLVERILVGTVFQKEIAQKILVLKKNFIKENCWSKRTSQKSEEQVRRQVKRRSQKNKSEELQEEKVRRTSQKNKSDE